MKRAITFFLFIGMMCLTGCIGAKKDASIIDQIDVTQIEKTAVDEKPVDDDVEYTWNDGGEKVTADWLKEEYDLSDEDLEGIDVEKVAWALWWDCEYVLEEYKDKENLLITMRATQKQLDTPAADNTDLAYSIIFDLENKTGMPDFDTLTRVDFEAFFHGEGSISMISGLLDVKAKKIYYLEGGDVSQLIGTDYKAVGSVKEYDLTDDEIEYIISHIEAGRLDSYISTELQDGWRVAFEFEDGSAYSYPLYSVYSDWDQMNMVVAFFSKMETEDRHTQSWFKMPEQE